MASAADSTPAMTNLGIKRKDMYPSSSPATPKSSKDYDNELVFPEVDVSGPQAEKMGAADLTAGECVKQTVIWKVKRLEKTETNGKTEHRVTFQLVKGGELESCKDDEDESEDAADGGDDEAAEGEEDEPSPGLAYILAGKGAKAAG